MNFTAPAFVLLFPIVLALHWMLPPSRRWVLLLVASLGFYAVGSPQALPLLAGITLGTYAAALGIAKSKTQTAKKLWLTCAAVLCIGCLCLFKYAGIFRTDVPLLLPAGISFYTFHLPRAAHAGEASWVLRLIRQLFPAAGSGAD